MNLSLRLWHLAATCGGFPPEWYCDPKTGQEIKYDSFNDILILLGNAVRILLALGGGLAVIMIVYGSVWYVISMGDPGRIKKAKDLIVNSIVGLVIMMVAYAVISYVAGYF